MSVDLNTVVPVNGLNDCIAQPPKDHAAVATAAISEQPLLNGVAHVSSPSNVSSDDGDDISAAPSNIALSSMDDTVASPLDGKGEDNLVGDKKWDIQDVNIDSPLVFEPFADPYEHQQSPPKQVHTVDVPDLNIAGPSSSRNEEVSENEINREVIDLDTDPHFCDEKKTIVGYDRGLEADCIVGITKRDGKFMFLMTWKNSVDGEADLLEATEVYNKNPLIALKFFESIIKFT